VSDNFVFYEEPGVKASVSVASTGAVMLHVDIDDGVWGVSMYKRLLEKWFESQELLKDRGVKEVFTLVPDEEKVRKFQELFGLIPLLEFKDGVLYRGIL